MEVKRRATTDYIETLCSHTETWLSKRQKACCWRGNGSGVEGHRGSARGKKSMVSHCRSGIAKKMPLTNRSPSPRAMSRVSLGHITNLCSKFHWILFYPSKLTPTFAGVKETDANDEPLVAHNKVTAIGSTHIRGYDESTLRHYQESTKTLKLCSI